MIDILSGWNILDEVKETAASHLSQRRFAAVSATSKECCSKGSQLNADSVNKSFVMLTAEKPFMSNSVNSSDLQVPNSLPHKTNLKQNDSECQSVGIGLVANKAK